MELTRMFTKRTSCFLTLALLLSALPVTADAQSVSQANRDALMAIYNATGGASWTNHTNWGGTAATVGNWYGVTVTGGKVTKINFSNNNLTGSLPADLGTLTDLNWMHLKQNNLSGSLPAGIGNLTKLTFLGLNDNDFTSNLPTEIGNLINLTEFYAQGNQFDGSVPVSFGNLIKLQYVNLSNNRFSGLPNLGTLSALKELRVETNALQFDDLEINQGVASSIFNYTPQATVGTPQAITVGTGATLNLTITVGGTFNAYKWYKDNVIIALASSPTYSKPAVTSADAGVYRCEIGNTHLTALTLTHASFTVTIDSYSVTTNAATAITSSTATVGGSIANSPTTVTQRGICWGTATAPLITGAHLDSGTGTGSFTAGLTGLLPSTLYYARAYSVNTAGTTYGNEITFTTAVFVADLADLTAFYNATDGPNWTNHTNWLTNPDISTWFGVTVVGGRVTKLELPDNRLRGTIPTTSITNLTNLVTLDLSNNFFEFSNLDGLQPIVFSPTIAFTYAPQKVIGVPETISVGVGDNATLYSHITVVSNTTYEWQNYSSGNWIQTGGNLNLDLFTVAYQLDNFVYRCKATNSEFPALTLYTANKTLDILTDRDILTAFYNYNGGPNWLISSGWNTSSQSWSGVTFDPYSGKVTRIILPGNHLTGPLYPGLSRLTELTTLEFSNNLITGGLPEQWGSLQKLTRLMLDHNQIAGSIPDSWGSLTSLENLNLSNNFLAGAVPSSLASIMSLRYCYLSYNLFSDIPNFGPVLSQPGGHLDVSYNKLEFDDLQRQVPRPAYFVYWGQAPVNELLTLNVIEGQPVEFSVETPGTQLNYSWTFPLNMLPPAPDDFYGTNTATLHITAMKQYMEGLYQCSITNTSFPSITLYRQYVQVNFIPAGLDNQIPDWYITLNQSSNQMRNKIMIPAFVETGLASLKVYAETSTTGDFAALSTEIPLTGSPTGYSFIDTGSDPTTRTYTYSISVSDGLGNESSLSDSQTSVHLVINLGLNNSRNLLWTSYEGLPVENYEVFGGSSMVLSEMTSLALLPSHLNSYTDHGTYSYYVVVTHLTGIPGMLKGGSLMQSVSNIFATNGLSDAPGKYDLWIYPNPVRDQVTLQFSNPGSTPHTLTVYDLTGKTCKLQENITSGEFVFQRGPLPKGVYYLRLVGDNVFTGKMVVD